MTQDRWVIIGTMATIGSVIVALGAIRINQNSELNTRIRDGNDVLNSRAGNVNTRSGDLRSRDGRRLTTLRATSTPRTDVRRMGERLHNVSSVED